MKRTQALLLAAVFAVFAPGAAAVDPQSAATATAAATAAAYSPPWTWPLDPRPALLRPFDPPAQQWLAGHRGIDVAAADGSAVLAPADGRVIFARRVVDRPVLTIDHGGGLKSSFEPVEASVPVGSVVSMGTAVGSVRSGSHCGPGCVHWGVRLDGEYMDPLAYVSDRRPSVLLPLGRSNEQITGLSELHYPVIGSVDARPGAFRYRRCPGTVPHGILRRHAPPSARPGKHPG